MITAHVIVSHPTAKPAKYSVQHHDKVEVEVGIATVVVGYARENRVPLREVNTKVTWVN